MTAMAYSGYDAGFNRSLSRRQSVAYGAPPFSHQGMYTEPMIPHALSDVSGITVFFVSGFLRPFLIRASIRSLHIKSTALQLVPFQ